ncbi:hypothetical protein [Tritonibacter mobilis]|uniref:hypothetical protein n=1 Tax=Tritonibacter mobilis TaxID=379347 RepID=UPI000806B766|nr:hypothetical protein [Tritonibacter mobilis]GLP88331.1 hypothetical protein GCM10007921_38940 [Tritonibacter mobilis]SDX37567.1 hypothetical protein SAMN05444385_10712 [Tritonibacter mobilis]
MNDHAVLFWTPFETHPYRDETLRGFVLAIIVVLCGPALWSFIILAVSFGPRDISALISVAFILVQVIFILRARWQLTAGRVSPDVLRNRFGLNGLRTMYLSFTFLGWALAYGSDGFYWCVGATVLVVIAVELRAMFLARRISSVRAQELVGSCIERTTGGTLYLKTAGPSLAGTDLGAESLWIEKFGLWILGGAPLLGGLAFSGAGDSVAGLIVTAFGLFFYSASMGNWVASRLLRRVISNIGFKGGERLTM